MHTADENSARRSAGLPFGTELSNARIHGYGTYGALDQLATLPINQDRSIGHQRSIRISNGRIFCIRRVRLGHPSSLGDSHAIVHCDDESG